MNLTDILGAAWKAINANKLRTFLTMLGVIIGVTAVIMMVAIGSGTEATISENINSLGANLIFITPNPSSFSGTRGPRETLVYSDVLAIRSSVTNLTGVSVEQNSRQTVKVGTNTLSNVSMTGTSPDFPQVRGLTIGSGRFFNDNEVTQKSKVVVLGATVASQLFDTTNPIGQYVSVGNNVRMTVIGVFQPKGSVGGTDYDSRIFLPITVLFQQFLPNEFARLQGDAVNSIYVATTNKDVMTDVIVQITELLATRHKVTVESPDFSIRTQDDIITAQTSTSASFRNLLAGVAAVSLLVGGIGIMNIMLVSVTERTREIGLRQAIGATPNDIRVQFLSEAMFLSIVGGIIGILTGILGSYLFNQFGGMRTVVVPESILLAFVASAAVGIFFGFVPANRAAGLDPIVALRHE